MIQNGDILDGIYQIINEIGRGGTGIIYLAEHLRLQKKVVVKKIKDHFVGQVNGRAEVDILKRLHHTYLPQVYDFLVIGTSIYTVMEYVEGQDLQQYMSQGYHFPEKIVQKWLLQLCEVLEYLHTQTPTILHSDIKPSNIMITKQGNVCLIDFNISLDGEISKDIQGVSPWFAAPEQYEKAENVRYGRQDTIVLDEKMDIYSLGASFYSVMTGLLPSPDKEQYQDIFSMEIPYSDGIRAIVAKAMRKKESARFQSANQMKKALQDVGKMDPLYRRYSYIQISSILIGFLCSIIGGLFLYYGSWQNGVEKWQQAYQNLYLSVQSEEETKIVSRGTEILNSVTYKGYLKKHEEKRAEVLHVVGDSYFRQEAFEEAVSYYKDAWDLKPEDGEYCKDYAIALVRSGKISKASQVMKSAKGLENLSPAEHLLIQAEISKMAEDYGSALAQLRELESLNLRGEETEVYVNGYLLAASIYDEQEEYKKAVVALEAAERLKHSKEILRHMGQSAVKAASSSDRTVNQNTYLQKAYDCYQSLNGNSNPSYEDKLNLALVEQAMGKYEESNSTLKEMNQTYKEDYKILMLMCYNYLKQAKARGSYGKDLEELQFYFEDCKHRYEAYGQSDQEMDELIEIMKRLE